MSTSGGINADATTNEEQMDFSESRIGGTPGFGATKMMIFKPDKTL